MTLAVAPRFERFTPAERSNRLSPNKEQHPNRVRLRNQRGGERSPIKNGSRARWDVLGEPRLRSA